MNAAARALRASLAEALALLARRPLSDAAVHEARKELKRSRAALRLLRVAVGEARFRAANAALRDAGRSLAALREPASLATALRALRERYPRELPGPALAAAAKKLRVRRAEALRALVRPDGPYAQCLRLVERCRVRGGTREFEEVTPELLAEGLERIYARGRKAYRAARKTRSHEALHEWRKQVKYLLNARAILGDASRSQPARLAERLGEDHDLHLLGRRLRLGPGARARMAARRAKLQEQALALGAKVYRRKPRSP